MAYRFVPFSMTLNQSLWRSFVCCKVFRIQFYEYFFRTFRTVLTDMARRAVPRRQLSFLSYLLLYVTLLSSYRARLMRVIYRARSCCVWTSGDPLLCPPLTAVVSGAKASPVCEFHTAGSASPTECCGIFDWRCSWNMNEITVNHHHRPSFSLAVKTHLVLKFFLPKKTPVLRQADCTDF